MLFDILLWLFAWAGFTVVTMFIGERAWALYKNARKEAAEHNKQVEFAGFVVGIIGVVLAIASLVYSITQVDNLQDRVMKLEMASPPQTVSSMSEITDQEVEALARAMLRETIERAGWYPELRGKFRQERIDQDVERYWHLMINDARKRLEQRNEA